MIHPLRSLQSRCQRWMAFHFEKTVYGRRLAKYRDLHKGQRCFIIANGPSLRADDLDKLADANEITFAMNRIYKMFDQTRWRPTYYVCEDELIALSQQKEICSIPARAKFIPAEIKWYHGVNIKDAVLFHINYSDSQRFPFSFSTDIPHQVDCRGTVTFTCMEFAAYMGFSEIYLLGVDHNYQVTIDIDGNVIVDPNAKDYFCDGYDSDIKEQVVHDMGNNTRAYLDAQEYCRQSGKCIIYNATRGGKLEVFERVDFDSLLKTAEGN